MATTIQISDNVKKSLDKIKVFQRQTYNEVIEDMIEDNLELNEKTKKEIKERSKSDDFVSMEDVEKHLGL